jgi:hypothetical protein
MSKTLATPVDDELDPDVKRSYVYLCAIVAAVGGFIFGYDLSIVSGALIFLRAEFDLPPRLCRLFLNSYIPVPNIPVIGLLFHQKDKEEDGSPLQSAHETYITNVQGPFDSFLGRHCHWRDC